MVRHFRKELRCLGGSQLNKRKESKDIFAVLRLAKERSDAIS